MSRKTNNLRNRLRIERERHALRNEQRLAAIEVAERRGDEIGRLRQRLDQEMRGTFAKSVMIRVEREIERYRFGLYSTAVTFSPEAYVRMSRYEMAERRTFEDVSWMAEEIGHRIGHMVTQAIVEQIKKDSPVLAGSR